MSALPIIIANPLSPCRNNKNNNNNDHIDDLNITIKPTYTQLAFRINKFLENEASTPLLRRVQAQTRIALDVIHTALERYSLEEISLSYNGGKDCLVLLILLLGALAGAVRNDSHIKPVATATSNSSPKSKPGSSSFPQRLSCIYVMAPHSFPEVDSFVAASTAAYGLDLVQYDLPMKEAFTQYLDENKTIKAILVGTRRTDPHGKLLTHFDETDSGWPSFMRVHPVIDWNYSEIWAFIRHLRIPYCKLYDQGYTSLGGISDTHPNPALKIDNAMNKYKPAYELLDEDAERLGRDENL